MKGLLNSLEAIISCGCHREGGTTDAICQLEAENVRIAALRSQ